MYVRDIAMRELLSSWERAGRTFPRVEGAPSNPQGPGPRLEVNRSYRPHNPRGYLGHTSTCGGGLAVLAPVPLPVVGADRGAPAALHLAHAAHTAVDADRGAPAALHLAISALPAVDADRGAPAARHLALAALPAVLADPRTATFLTHVLLPPVGTDRAAPEPLHLAHAALPAVGADRGARKGSPPRSTAVMSPRRSTAPSRAGGSPGRGGARRHRLRRRV